MSRTLTAFNGGDHRNFDVVKIQIKTALTAGGYRGENSRARRTRLQGIFCGRARWARLFRGSVGGHGGPAGSQKTAPAGRGYRRKDRPHRGRLQGNGCRYSVGADGGRASLGVFCRWARWARLFRGRRPRLQGKDRPHRGRLQEDNSRARRTRLQGKRPPSRAATEKNINKSFPVPHNPEADFGVGHAHVHAAAKRPVGRNKSVFQRGVLSLGF